ncbi:MAG: hypothetical protein P4L36_14445 [Holophaga sp.]|nr:hypothetical protein [Holophaga sp.]
MDETFSNGDDRAVIDAYLANPDAAAGAPAMERRLAMYEHLFARIQVLMSSQDSKADLSPMNPATRVSPLAFAVVRQRGPSVTAAKDSPDWAPQVRARLDFLDSALTRLLSATEETAYDSAYAIRGSLVDEYVGPTNNKVTEARELIRLNLLELAKDDITYSEQSCSPRNAEFCSPSNMHLVADTLREPLAALGKPIPEVHFLVMFTQHMSASLAPLGSAGSDTWTFINSRGERENGPAPVNAKNQTLLVSMEKEAGNPLNQENVAGVDILSPEKNVVTPSGQENFKRLIKAVYATAFRNKRRLLVRTHVGEGIPVEVPRTELSTPRRIETRSGGKPLHYELARDNVEQLLLAVEEFRESLGSDGARADFDDHVRIRFGHASHATEEQGARMRRAHIWADMCLTSNITTTTVIGNHDDHSLAPLTKAGVSLMFGSDGSGVEHVVFRDEPTVALRILTAAGFTSENALAAVNRMLNNSRDYAEWMRTPPTRTIPTPPAP